MNKQELILQISKEGREWLSLLLPYLVPYVAGHLIGWHQKQPPWMRKYDDRSKPDAREC